MMGVIHINYKIAECDICGTQKNFEPVDSLPVGWDYIKGDIGYIKYLCVCPECLKRVKGYIEEFKALHHKSIVVENEKDESTNGKQNY